MPVAETPPEHLDRARRWLLAGTGLALAGLLGWLVAPSGAGEVITAPGDGSNSGVTSTVAPSDLSTTLWTLDRWATTGWFHPWPIALGENHLLVEAGHRILIHRDTGAAVVAPPVVRAANLGAIDADGHVLVAEGDLVLEIDLRGRVAGARPLEGAPVARAAPLTPLPDGGWLIHDGRSTMVLDDDLTLRWTHGDSSAHWAEVSIPTDDTVLIHLDERVRAHDVTSGELLWEHAHRPGGRDSALVVGELVLLAPPGGVLAIDRRSGETVWERSGLLDVPERWLIATDDVAVGARGSGRGELITVDLATGEPRGRLAVPLADTAWAVQPLTDGLVGPMTGARGIGAVDVDGHVRWHREDLDDPRVMPDARTDREVVVAVGDGGVEILDPVDGSTLARHDIQAPLAMPLPWFGSVDLGLHDRLLVLPPDERTGPAVVDLATGERVAGFDDLRDVWSTRVLPAGLVLHDRGRPRLLDDRGRPRYDDLDHRVGRVLGQTRHGLVADVSARGGGIALLDPETGDILGDVLREATDQGTGVPVTSGDTVIAPVRSGGPSTALVALRTGPDGPRVAWRGDTATDARLLADGTHVASIGLATVGVRTLEDGTAVSTFALRHVVQGAALADGTLVITSPGGDLTTADLTTGDIRWTTELPAPPTASPTVAGDVVHVGLEDGTVARIRLDGERLPPVEAGVGPVVATLPARGILVVQGTDGVTALGPAELPDELTTPRELPPDEVDLPLP